jgi:ABC-2 type transport system permease protein
MRRALAITANDLRIFFLNRGNLISLIVIPVALALVIGAFLPGGSEGDGTAQVRVDIIDHDHSALSTQFIETLRQVNDSLLLCPMDAERGNCQLEEGIELDTAQARERVEAGASLAMIEIPADFGARLRAFEPVEIRYLSDEDLTAPGFIRQAVEAAIQRTNGAVVASRVGSQAVTSLSDISVKNQSAFAQRVYDRAAGLWESNPVETRYELTAQTPGEDSGMRSGFQQSVPGMATMYVMSTVFGGMVALVGERKQWTLQRLVVMPVSRTQFLGGKILARFSLGMIQFVVVFAVGILLGLDFGDDPLAVVLIMLSYTLAVTALSFALGTQLETEAQAGGLAQLLVLTLAPLGGAWWPIEVVPDFLRVIGHVSPVAWAMDGFHSLMFYNGDLSTVLVPIGVLLGITVASFGVGIWRFKYI